MWRLKGLVGLIAWGILLPVGAVVFFIALSAVTGSEGMRALDKVVAVASVVFWLIAIMAIVANIKKEDKAAKREDTDASSVRSQWERDIFDYVRQQSGCSGARANDRSVIVASDGHTPLEIDIYIPGLRLGIEADGTRWHDRDAYRRDQQNSTEYSEEMYKERYCARRGIKLIHVWDEDGEAEVRRQIDAAIREQRNKLNTW